MRLLVASVVSVIAGQALSQPQYEVVDLTAIYGQGFAAVSINDSGVIGGNYFGRACIAQNGKLTMLPKWKGEDWSLQDFADNGNAVGWSLGKFPYESVYYDATEGTVIDMDVSHPIIGAVQAVNSVGQATGQVSSQVLNNAFIWEDGAVTQFLKPFGGGLEINDSGTVVGFGGTGPFAAMWVGGAYQNLHPAWAVESEAVAVNELDEAVGRAWAPGLGFHALLWRKGKVIDLGNLGMQNARGYDINNLTQIVGSSTNPKGIVEGFIWEEGAMYRLTDHIGKHPGFLWLEAAHDINGQGQILSTAAGGKQLGHSLLLNPVPEPSSVIVLSGACGLLCGVRFCRYKRQRGRKNENNREEGMRA